MESRASEGQSSPASMGSEIKKTNANMRISFLFCHQRSGQIIETNVSIGHKNIHVIQYFHCVC